MLESNVAEGRQDLAPDPTRLKYGVSITDGCIGWTETEELILSAYEQLAAVTRTACPGSQNQASANTAQPA